MPDIKGKVAIVTGASAGIGASLAKQLSLGDARVTLVARRRARLEEVEAACSGETLVLEADVTNVNDRARIVASTLERWGRIDIMINNAGIGSYGPFHEATDDQWRRLIEVNLLAPVFLTRAVLPIMLEQEEGLIINVASIGGLMAHADNVTPYITTKHALVGLSRGLEKDLEGTGIRVLAVCPHLTQTELFEVAPGAEQMAPVIEKFRKYMDTSEQVAEGIIAQLDAERLIVFPTPAPEKAFDKYVRNQLLPPR